MTNPATAKQTTFIVTLAGERIAPEGIDVAALLAGGTLTTSAASNLITALLASPRKPRVAAAPAGNFEGVEISKYAVPAGYFVMMPHINFTGDLLFLEVAQWQGRKYLRRLHGAPGDFVRSKFAPADQAAIVDIIRGRHVEFARLFGEHYTCCGRCAAPLTDERSRQTGFGPECRKLFGLK